MITEWSENHWELAGLLVDVLPSATLVLRWLEFLVSMLNPVHVPHPSGQQRLTSNNEASPAVPDRFADR
jgi:hypothetical protein